MRWEPDNDNRNIVDLRGGGGGGARIGGRIGLGGAAVLLVLSLVFGRNFFADLGHGGGAVNSPQRAPAAGPLRAGDDSLAEFTKFVFNDAQRFWQADLRRRGIAYEDAKLVLFTDSVRSGCGYAESAMGPFYCPADERVYVDLGFYGELKRRFHAPGDFAQAYVIAHEVGHHIQRLDGTEARVRSDQRARPSAKNALSVRLELQADCLAGVWAHSVQDRKRLDPGDLEEGLGAASAVGDDRIQKAATGRVNPERWTHGSARDRATWFRRGFSRGQKEDCDTFAADR
jgi:predicted metalloprotease